MVSGDVQIAVLVQKFVFFLNRRSRVWGGVGSSGAAHAETRTGPHIHRHRSMTEFTVVPCRLLQHADAATCPAGMLLVDSVSDLPRSRF